MTAPAAAHPDQASRALKTILRAGMLAGLLDGLDALLFIGIISGIPVIRVFQFIASGLLGPGAFRGGWATAGLGVVLHFFIATAAAAVFYALSVKLTILLHKPLVWGPLYGMGVFLFMHYVVVPLSRTPKQAPATAADLANLIFSHVFFVGIPIAWITSRARSVNARTSPQRPLRKS
jgi:hypothetical protein